MRDSEYINDSRGVKPVCGTKEAKSLGDRSALLGLGFLGPSTSAECPSPSARMTNPPVGHFWQAPQAVQTSSKITGSALSAMPIASNEHTAT